MSLGDAAFGGVDHAHWRGREALLEHSQVGGEALLGVGRVALPILDAQQRMAIARDVLPLLHLERAEPPGFRSPCIVVAGARRVGQTVGKAEILPNKYAVRAPHPLGELERKVRHRRRRG